MYTEQCLGFAFMSSLRRNLRKPSSKSPVYFTSFTEHWEHCEMGEAHERETLPNMGRKWGQIWDQFGIYKTGIQGLSQTDCAPSQRPARHNETAENPLPAPFSLLGLSLPRLISLAPGNSRIEVQHQRLHGIVAVRVDAAIQPQEGEERRERENKGFGHVSRKLCCLGFHAK